MLSRIVFSQFQLGSGDGLPFPLAKTARKNMNVFIVKVALKGYNLIFKLHRVIPFSSGYVYKAPKEEDGNDISA